VEIVNLDIIESFKRQHSTSRKSLQEWVNKTLIANWATSHDVTKVFPAASFVKEFVIFNIAGNRYRLLTKIAYDAKKVRVLKAGTHREYDRWKL